MSDRGKMFYNKAFLVFFTQNEVQIFSTNSDLKAVFDAWFNRTRLDLIKEPRYIEGKASWLNHLDPAMENYNNRVHGTTKMTPFKASNDKRRSSLIPSNNKILPKFQKGDFARVSDERNLYSKVIQQIGIENILKYIKLTKTNSVTYGLVDGNNEQIEEENMNKNF